MGSIYTITNKINGHQYVGLTTCSLSKRRGEHISSAKNHTRDTTIVRALRKYGAHNFDFEEICHCFNDGDLPETEKYFIKLLEPAYNQTNGGEVTQGRSHSPEVREKLSNQLRQFHKDHPEEMLKRLERARNVPYTDDRKHRLSVLATGRKHTEEAKVKMKEHAKENNISTRLNAFTKNRSVSVKCLNDGMKFESAKAADVHYNLPLASTWQVISGRIKSTHGLKFEKI